MSLLKEFAMLRGPVKCWVFTMAINEAYHLKAMLLTKIKATLAA